MCRRAPRYVDGHRPCLFRGVDINSTGFQKWDPEYIAAKFGDSDVKIEPKKVCVCVSMCCCYCLTCVTLVSLIAMLPCLQEARGDSSVLNYLPKRLSIKGLVFKHMLAI